MGPRHLCLSMSHGGDDPVCKIVNKGNQKMSRPHRWVTDLEIQKFLCRVRSLQCTKALIKLISAGTLSVHFSVESFHAFINEWPDRFPNNERNKIVGRVVAP